MTALDAMPLVPSESVSSAELSVVEQWAQEKRLELERLTAELRRAQADAEAAEVELALVQPPVTAGPRFDPSALIPMVDAMLNEAMGRLDAEVEAARADAAAVMAGAMLKAHELFETVGADLRVVAPLPAIVEPEELPRPRDAAALWQDVLEEGIPAPEVVVDLTAPDPLGGPFDEFWAGLEDEPPVRERLRRWVHQRQP